MSTAGKRGIHSLQWGKFLSEAGLKFLYQDQIVTYWVRRDGVPGLTQARQCSAAELHPDLQFPPSNSDFVFSLVCVSFKHTAGISSPFR